MAKYFFPKLAILLAVCRMGNAQSFTLESVKSYPFPTELTASSSGSKIAWAVDEQGKRNVYVAEGPDFKPRRLTHYTADDAQEITSLSISADGQWVVYVRGGEHGSNWDGALPVNPAFAAEPLKVQLISIPFAGGEAKTLAEGDDPALSPKSDVVVFVKSDQVHTVPIDGSAASKNLFTTRGTVSDLQWSPDGSRLAFVTTRGDHALVGVFKDAATPLQWIAPAFARDRSPRWSPDGSKLVFVRLPSPGGTPDSLLTRRHNPWSLWVADAASGKASLLWAAPKTLRGSLPTTHGGTNLHWGASNRVVFLSYHDGWPHLYSIPAQGGKEMLLTPGNFMAEHIRLSADKKWLTFSANTGPDALDLDRRHIVRVPVDRAAPEVLTPGNGLEWTPVITGDGATLACIGATAQRPPLPVVMPLLGATKRMQPLAADLIPKDFPLNKLVTPSKVTFTASDGATVHADVFTPPSGVAKKPAIVYVHGGPPRQMLLGWHYSEYYSNAYALNQYLASLGFVVVSVNYRLGIGYGFDFHQPARAGASGASEYLDVKAAGEWLSKQPNVDPSRIGIYGGSYGGFLTALALARDSKLFTAGVDIHGVHDFITARDFDARDDHYEKIPDFQRAKDVAWQSSPVAYVSTWTSPVLIIHADDDRNVRFNQSTDLVVRLEKKGVPLETLVVVDDTHHWMKYSNAVKIDRATAEFFVKYLKP
ncbi:S9 family peptidase [Chryseolinea lacunae]|uniref:Acyl-peptide hydrolase n=1 Tax=Chryseolinea lacunae TaxID=2801331 RepID=A0ABS1KLX3_9BACT|nr:LpqB family beta-propeller domain-containing protein [Chryseolinea lacunae]MBL0740456.1 S9 family peptidase [Chryseolinea lacunae]